MSLRKRVNEIENKVLQKPEVGTTRFCMCDLPEPEQIILEKARKIASLGITWEESSEDQRKLIEKAGELLNFRIFDLFTSYLDELLCKGDPIARVLLHERFLWFIHELIEEIRQNLEVSELEKNTPEDSEVDVVDEYFRKAKPVFTEDSYDELTTEITFDLIKAGKLKVPA